MVSTLFWDDVLPGDTFNMKTTAFARLATPLFPLMDNAFIDTHFFFVPYRLLWDDSKKFFGEQVDPDDDISSTSVPMTTGNIGEGTFQDHLGLPIGTAVRYSDLYERFRS